MPQTWCQTPTFLTAIDSSIITALEGTAILGGVEGGRYEVSERLSDFSQATQLSNAKAGIYTKFKGLVKFIF